MCKGVPLLGGIYPSSLTTTSQNIIVDLNLGEESERPTSQPFRLGIRVLICRNVSVNELVVSVLKVTG